VVLDHIINEALADVGCSSGNESIPEISGMKPLLPGHDEQILIFGLGSTGCSILKKINKSGGPGIRTIAVNNNRESLEYSGSSVSFFLKSSYFPSGSYGLCGGNPDLIKRYTSAMEQALPDFEPLTGSPEICFILAGLGGNMGTGSAPVIARMMQDKGSIVTAIVVLPATIEITRRLRAEEGIRNLKPYINTMIVLDLDQLKNLLPGNVPFMHHFLVIDQIVTLTVRNIIESIHSADAPLSVFTFDFEDIRDILKIGGLGTILIAEAACNETISSDQLLHPLLRIQFGMIKGAIFHITAGNDTCIFENEMLVADLAREFSLRAEVVWGLTIKREFEGRKLILAIATTCNKWE
jgi:cell division protein FtsZ